MLRYGWSVSSTACRRALWVMPFGFFSPSFAVLFSGVARRHMCAKSSVARFAIAGPTSPMRWSMKGGCRLWLYGD